MKSAFFMKKKLLMLVVLLGCSLYAFAGNSTTLTIHFKNGTTTDIMLYTRPQVFFEGEQIVIKSPVATLSYPSNEVVRFTYMKDGIPVGISSPDNDGAFKQSNNQIIFNKGVKIENIQLFSEDGKCLTPVISNANGRCAMSLSSLPAGVYILNVNGQTSKILKK